MPIVREAKVQVTDTFAIRVKVQVTTDGIGEDHDISSLIFVFRPATDRFRSRRSDWARHDRVLSLAHL